MFALLESLMEWGSVFATLMFIWAMYQQYIPDHLRHFIKHFLLHYTFHLSPYQEITFHEFSGAMFDRNEAYSTIDTYLSERSSNKANCLKANFLHGNSLMLSIADQEQVTDQFSGLTVWWISCKTPSNSTTISVYPGSDDQRFYRLVFNREDREIVTTSYLDHVLEEGKAITVQKRQRKLYTNTQGPENGTK